MEAARSPRGCARRRTTRSAAADVHPGVGPETWTVPHHVRPLGRRGASRESTSDPARRRVDPVSTAARAGGVRLSSSSFRRHRRFHRRGRLDPLENDVGASPPSRSPPRARGRGPLPGRPEREGEGAGESFLPPTPRPSRSPSEEAGRGGAKPGIVLSFPPS